MRDSPLPPFAKRVGDREEHDAFARKIWKRFGFAGDPSPCDCGYFDPESGLVTCRPEERVVCRAKVGDRLREHWKRLRESEARERRRWPGKEPHAGARPGFCRWCGLAIMRPDGVRLNLRKTRHDDCLIQFLVRVSPDAMRRFVFERDRGACYACGRVHDSLFGHWQADHRKCLALAKGDPDFWAPENVGILCTSPCHADKTRADFALIAADRRATKEEDHEGSHATGRGPQGRLG